MMLGKDVIYTSDSINTLDQLQRVIGSLASKLPPGAAPWGITLTDTMRLQLIEIVLTDGSKVYDVRLIEE